MSEEIKNESSTTEVTEKIGFFKKTWKTIVTGIVCAVVGGGVVAGADVAKISETITKAQAKQIAIQAASYAAEQVISKISTISTSESKLNAVKEAIEVTTNQIPTIMEGVTAIKEEAKEISTTAKETKEEVKEAKETSTTKTTEAKEDTTTAKTEVKVEAKAPVKK